MEKLNELLKRVKETKSQGMAPISSVLFSIFCRTRILKDGLSGTSEIVMVATISPADSQYHHTVNTLKYVDRAKEIKRHPGEIMMLCTHLDEIMLL